MSVLIPLIMITGVKIAKMPKWKKDKPIILNNKRKIPL